MPVRLGPWPPCSRFMRIFTLIPAAFIRTFRVRSLGCTASRLLVLMTLTSSGSAKIAGAPVGERMGSFALRMASATLMQRTYFGVSTEPVGLAPSLIESDLGTHNVVWLVDVACSAEWLTGAGFGFDPNQRCSRVKGQKCCEHNSLCHYKSRV